MRFRRSIPWLLTGALIAACSPDSGTSPHTDSVAQYANAFEQIADSMHGTVPPNDASADIFHHVAQLLRLTGHTTPVTITVDGTTIPMLAVSEELDLPIGCPGFAAPAESSWTPPDTSHAPCPPTMAVRSLIAWDASSLTHIVRVVADTGSSQLTLPDPGVMRLLPRKKASGRIVVADTMIPAPPPTSPPGPPTGPPAPQPAPSGWFAGDYILRGVGDWIASEGTERNSLVSSGGACTADSVVVDSSAFRCQALTLGFEFSMTVSSAFIDTVLSMTTTPTVSTHVVTMAATSVDGVRLVYLHGPPGDSIHPPPDSVPPPPDSVPPDSVPGDSLTAYLVAYADSASTTGDILFHFVVSNPTSHPIAIDYPTGQSFDMEVRNSSGTVLWRWSTGVVFTPIARSETLAAGASLAFDGKWTPTAHGAITASAWLTSSNHPMRASSYFTIP
ncbi:MAG TPA: BsuPI-related putative proteinase inhibitor [Gemmatimonadaceae bacterium]|nr:BsuPI-related putative proteinase inhibitor [Gemmatimonadaceae bacterium]